MRRRGGAGFDSACDEGARIILLRVGDADAKANVPPG